MRYGAIICREVDNSIVLLHLADCNDLQGMDVEYQKIMDEGAIVELLELNEEDYFKLLDDPTAISDILNNSNDNTETV